MDAVNVPEFKYALLECHWIVESCPVLDVSTRPGTIVGSAGKSTGRARSCQNVRRSGQVGLEQSSVGNRCESAASVWRVILFCA